MKAPKNILSLLVLALLAAPNASAQKDNQNKSKVVVVDDEACGCELVFIDGIQTIERDGLYGFKREDGTVFVEPQYKWVDEFHGNYCIVYSDDTHCGLIDRSGRVVVPPIFQSVIYPSDGMIRIQQNNRFGFFDTIGHQRIPCKYRTASGFSEGLAVVNVDIDSFEVRYGYINKQDSMVIPPIYEYAATFEEGYAVAVAYDRRGMIDHQNREVLPFKYLDISPMHDGNFFAIDPLTERAALFDNHFQRLTDFVYDQISNYSEGIYVVHRDGGFTFLDQKGHERFGLWDEAGGFYDGYSMVKRDGKFGIINNRGKLILPVEYEDDGYLTDLYAFAENLALVKKDGKVGFVNKQGKIVIPIIYDAARHCSEGLIPVKKNGVWGYIDKQGNVVCDFIFDVASHFEWGRASVVYRGETYKINTEGQCVKNCKTFPKQAKFHFKD